MISFVRYPIMSSMKTLDENLQFRGLALYLDSPTFVYLTLVVNSVLFTALLYVYFVIMYDGKRLKLKITPCQNSNPKTTP